MPPVDQGPSSRPLGTTTPPFQPPPWCLFGATREPRKENDLIVQVLADRVAALVLAKFGELTNNFASPYARRKVLAGVVLTQTPVSDSGVKTEDANSSSSDSALAACEPQVICVTTGTKCINGEYMSNTGQGLNDCHAEVIARRCLRRYLFKQLLLHLDPETAPTSVFERRPLEEGPPYFRIKDGHQFHLYISTSPCGDARIFAPHEMSVGGEGENGAGGATNGGINPVGDRHPNRKARGQLRTKIESGEGTIPVRSSGGIQTWDGVLQGERLLTMSCSDKIARWNILGIQGECGCEKTCLVTRDLFRDEGVYKNANQILLVHRS